MSWRLLTGLLIAVALALLPVLWWRELAPAGLGAPPGGPRSDSPTAVSALRGGNSPTATDVAATAGRSEVTAPSTPQRRVRIVDETGAPVADAEVTFDASPADDSRASPFWVRNVGPDIEERMPREPRLRSALDGMVAVPTDAESAVLIARAGERFGCGVVDFVDPLVDIPELLIAPDRTLHIAVVGPRGEPCPGVPVEVVYQDEEALVDAGTFSFDLPRTDEAGCVTLWHAQTLYFWNRTDPIVELRAKVVGASPPAERVRLVERPPEVIRLKCPEHGGIRVRAWFADGVPSQVSLDPYLCEIVQGAEVSRDAPVAPGSTRAEVLLHPVATGRQWRVGATGFVERQCEGPADRSQVVVDLLANGSHRVVTGVLIRPDGLPCASMSIRACEDTEMQHGDHTDATGRFHLALDSECTDLALEAVELRASAHVAVPKPSKTEPTADLGVIRLVNAELLAAGKVLDATTKQPLHAYLWERRRASSVATSSAADGSFELWGAAGDDLVIHAQKSGYATSIQSVKRGSRDVVVAMQRALQLRATVLVDPGITVDGLGVRIQNGNKRVGWSTSQSRPGRLTCLFTLPDADDLVLEVAGAEDMPAVRQVPRSEWTTHDGVSSATVDLRDAFANALVAIRAASGQEIGGSLYVRPLSSPTPWAELPLAPRVVFAAPKGTVIDAIVRPWFGMCVRTTLQLGENTIDVPPPARVQIEVAGMPREVARDALAVHVCRLVRREPLLDELVAAGLDVDPGEVQHWPRSPADVESMEREDFRQLQGEEGWFRFSLRRRGSYVAVPFVVKNEGSIALVDAAVALEITTPGAVVEATIRLDPEKVRAALR